MTRNRTKLSDSQLEAVRVLARYHDRPVMSKATTEAAINLQMAWSLHDIGLAWTHHTHNGGERVYLLPLAKQLLSTQLSPNEERGGTDAN